MRYISTRGNSGELTAAQAIMQGLAPDGGLLTPDSVPTISGKTIVDFTDMSYQKRAASIMGLYLDDYTQEELLRYAGNAYSTEKFDTEAIAPLHKLSDSVFCLELWHGPTCAFKDMALQMLPQLLSAALVKNQEQKTACILVATSGDTGKAALEGFKNVDRTRILVFYPKDGVSDIQELQMKTQEGKNVGVCAVVGNFDDAQSGVKKLFNDNDLKKRLSQMGYFLSSANSINWGRVLPQIVYYISAYSDLVRDSEIHLGDPVNICVPTGNFGNILAAYYAKCMGLPVAKLICASNRNNVLTDFLTTGKYNRKRTFYNTISPSMDILISSNLERLLFDFSGKDSALVSEYMRKLRTEGEYQVSDPIIDKMHSVFASGYSTDEEAKETIARMYREQSYLIDPHTADAFKVLSDYRRRTGDMTPCIVASTASPFKFCDSVLDALGIKDIKKGTAMLEQLAEVTGRPAPAPLASLKTKKVIFDQSITKEHMVDKVMEMLG